MATNVSYSLIAIQLPSPFHLEQSVYFYAPSRCVVRKSTSLTTRVPGKVVQSQRKGLAIAGS